MVDHADNWERLRDGLEDIVTVGRLTVGQRCKTSQEVRECEDETVRRLESFLAKAERIQHSTRLSAAGWSEDLKRGARAYIGHAAHGLADVEVLAESIEPMLVHAAVVRTTQERAPLIFARRLEAGGERMFGLPAQPIGVNGDAGLGCCRDEQRGLVSVDGDGKAPSKAPRELTTQGRHLSNCSTHGRTNVTPSTEDAHRPVRSFVLWRPGPLPGASVQGADEVPGHAVSAPKPEGRLASEDRRIPTALEPR
jgi:hypothetical protein